MVRHSANNNLRVVSAMVLVALAPSTLAQQDPSTKPGSAHTTASNSKESSANAEMDAAIESLDADRLQRALEAGANPNKRPEDGAATAMECLLSELTFAKHGEGALPADELDNRVSAMLILMCNSGGDVRLIRNPFSWPSFNNARRVTTELLDRGLDPNALGEQGMSPLYWAIRSRSAEVEGVLLARGAVPLKPQEDLQTRLVGSAYAGDLNAVKELVSRGAGVGWADPAGVTPLYEAIRLWKVDVVRFLLETGASPSASSKNGSLVDYPLHEAVMQSVAYGQGNKPDAVNPEAYEIVQLLLKHNAEVSRDRPYDGMTPLHVAAKWGIVRTAECLLKAGAKIMPIDSAGKTPLDYAASGPMIQLLKNHGAVEK